MGELVARVASVMTAITPDVVITFGPMGLSGHPDHVAVHHATVAAFHQYRHATFWDCGRWRDAGTWQRRHDTLRAPLRKWEGRHTYPTAGGLDRQSVKTTARGGERGDDSGECTPCTTSLHPQREALARGRHKKCVSTSYLRLRGSNVVGTSIACVIAPPGQRERGAWP